MSALSTATTVFEGGLALHLFKVCNLRGEIVGAEICIQTRPGQQRRTMRRREYRNVHDALLAYQAAVRRVYAGGEP